MQIRARLRHRPEQGELIVDRHRDFVRNLQNLRDLAVGYDYTLPELDSSTRGNLVSATSDLSMVVANGFSAAVVYGPRVSGRNLDRAANDDVLVIEFDSNQRDYSRFVSESFPGLVQAFKAYRGTVILNEDLDLDDYEQIVENHLESGLDVDGRDTVHRISSVNFFDGKLCRRAFGKEPEEIINRLSGSVERVEKLHDGVFIITTTHLITRSEIEAIDNEIRPILAGVSSD